MKIVFFFIEMIATMFFNVSNSSTHENITAKINFWVDPIKFNLLIEATRVSSFKQKALWI